MNPFFFWHFTLAHLITDYPLQTDKIFYKKTHEFSGIVIHGFLLLVLLLIFSYPYTFNLYVFIVCLLITVLHIIQDKIKTTISIKLGCKGENFFLYIGDQFLHIFVIYLFCLLPLPFAKGSGIWFNSYIFKLCVLIIFITYFIWILNHSVEATFLKLNKLESGNDKYFGFLIRILTLILFFLNPFLSILGFLAPFYFYFVKKEKILFLRHFMGILFTIVFCVFFKYIVL